MNWVYAVVNASPARPLEYHKYLSEINQQRMVVRWVGNLMDLMN